MSLSYKQIANHAISAANTEETFYTVPASTEVVGQVIVTNTSTSNNRTFRLAVISGGGATSAADYLAYDIALVPGESWVVAGLTLAATDVLRVESDATSTTAGTGIVFQLYGETITQS